MADTIVQSQAWKAHILFLHPDQTHSQQGIAATLEICKLDPPTTDLDTIDLLSSTLRAVPGHDGTARSLWEKAAKAKPQDHEIQSQWFTRSFEGEDWQSAQKVSAIIPGLMSEMLNGIYRLP